MDSSSIYRIALGTDAQPDPWQLAFMADAWPQALIAPTGSGKTAAVTLGWAAHRLRDPESTPRRLIWCMPMRTLVEQTKEVVMEWFGKLAVELDEFGRLPRPEEIHVLMGGVDGDRWLDKPERPAVLIGTQDMLLSRALMRGYGSSRALWPMQFALLHQDAQWVFDEVQLMGAGRATSAQLEAFRRSDADRARSEGLETGFPARSLWISATLDPQWLSTVDHRAPLRETVVQVDPGAAVDGRLARLAKAPKKLACSQVAPASATKPDVTAYVGRLADAIRETHRLGSMTLVIVNRVDRAQALYHALGQKLSEHPQNSPSLALIHSRYRPADRKREMDKVVGSSDGNPHGRIVIATQAVEAGVDISASVMYTEIAPWSSIAQRFGRANRYAEIPGGAEIYWVDLLQPGKGGNASDKDLEKLAIPYNVPELHEARNRLRSLTDVAPVNLPQPGDIEPPRRVIRRKDLIDLFDTDPDLTGFDVDISPYVRDADDTDIRVFWRDLSKVADEPPRPRREELCAVSIGAAKEWIGKVRKRQSGRQLLHQRDPQWRRGDSRSGAPAPGWTPFRDEPWPGLILLADLAAGGYLDTVGFTGNPKDVPEPLVDQVARDGTKSSPDVSDSVSGNETEGHDEDSLSQIGTIVRLDDHLRHVATEAATLCDALGTENGIRKAVVRAARWHDLGKAHDVFQDTMRRGLDGQDVEPGLLLAKTVKRTRHGRAYFRHELASALAFLAHEDWSRDADLTAYLIAAHHGKVRMNLRALPKEGAPNDSGRAGARFARGIWEGDELPSIDLEYGEQWEGGRLLLSIMEMGWDNVSHESWTERTRDLLSRFGPFRLAWMEALVRVADWRASAKEQDGSEPWPTPRIVRRSEHDG